MSLDLEMFLKDAFEAAIKANPDYANMRVRDIAIEIDNGAIKFREVDNY